MLPTLTLSPRPPPPSWSYLAHASAAHLHRAAVTFLPRLHEAVSALGGVQKLDREGVSGVWLGPCPSPTPLFPAPGLVP